MDKQQVDIAYANIKKDVLQTPLIHSSKLSEISGAKVCLKLENQQLTGSFKIRGVLNKMRSLDPADFDKTFVAASTGNHAAAFAYASARFGFKGKLFLPETVTEAKLKGLAGYEVEKLLYGKSSVEAEAKATEHAREIDGVLVHPYNDEKIIAGQGTIGLALSAQWLELDTVLAPIGGGGLISGLCLAFSENPAVSVRGCQPHNASEMYDSLEQDKIVPPSTLSTLADAAAGGIEEGALTFDICKKHLDGIELIEEEDMKKAVAFLHQFHDITVEPTATLPVAALLKSKVYQGKNVALVLTGSKISQQLLNEIIAQYGNSDWS